MPWIIVAPGAPYFITEQGENWTPIGQNDALSWPDLLGAYKRKDLTSVNRYFAMLSAHGITCMRVMLEYCQGEHRYLEKPAGVFHPAMVALWDDLFALCEKYGIRLLLTPFDSFWMRRRWAKHPYNRRNGGPCARVSQWLLCPATLQAVRQRLAFATRRWGGSGVIFGWDLYNEIDPRQAAGEVTAVGEWVSQVSTFLREEEIRCHGRAHLQTVSVYGPLLKTYPQLNQVVFRHPCLDFASVHFYDAPLRKPSDPVKAALRAGELVRQALRQITDGRPFLDSEHGPDCLFRQTKGRIPAAFDEAYFRCLQWAHLSAGGAGGGFRWPYRHPHSLTPGMRVAQRILSQVAAHVDWQHFDRRHLSEGLKVSPRTVKVLACGNAGQVLLWITRQGAASPEQEPHRLPAPLSVTICISSLQPGTYRLRAWNTLDGQPEFEVHQTLSAQAKFSFLLPLRRSDMVTLITRVN
jgi:mannan endo-1,4-beta-mannosidase